MIYKLLIHFIHTTPINHNDMSFLKIVHKMTFPKAVNQAKKAALKGIFVHQILYQEKKKANITTQDTIDLTLNIPLLKWREPTKALLHLLVSL